MFFIQFTFWIYHFWFYPYSEFDIFFLCFFNKVTKTTRQFFYVLLPVTKTRMIIIPWIFITEPAIIQQKHINAKLCSTFKQIGNFIFIKIKISGFPVI